MKLDGLGVSLADAAAVWRACAALARSSETAPDLHRSGPGLFGTGLPAEDCKPGERTMPRAVRCRRLDQVRTGHAYGTVPRGTTHWTGWLVI